MRRYVVLGKKIGETPLMALSAWKEKHEAYKDVPASYAGRLDPMASGKLLVLLGDECKKQKKYIGLDKEYEVEILCGVASDTGDALGIVHAGDTVSECDEKKIRAVLACEVGKHEHAYPIFSSKTVDGKPLFLHALEGTLADITIPTHTEHIYTAKLLEFKKLSKADLQVRIENFLEKVPKTDEPSKMLGADFRIDAVRASWEKVLEEEREYGIARVRIVCGSGTYMRSLAGRMGEALGTGALALSIHRTKIGKYWNGFWIQQKL